MRGEKKGEVFRDREKEERRRVVEWDRDSGVKKGQRERDWDRQSEERITKQRKGKGERGRKRERGKASTII